MKTAKKATITVTPETLELINAMSQHMPHTPIADIAHQAILRFAKHILPGAELERFLVNE